MPFPRQTFRSLSLVLLIALIGSSPAHASPRALRALWRDCRAAFALIIGASPTFGRIEGQAPLAPVPKKFADLTERLHGQPFDDRLLEGEWYEGEAMRNIVPDKAGDFDLYYAGALVANIGTASRKGSLRFDIEIKKRYRRSDLYQYLLTTALEQYPNVQQLPARMVAPDSDNASIFLQKAFSTRSGFRLFSPHRLKSAQGRALREKIYDAFYAMPAMKARERIGFGNVGKILLSTPNYGIAFIAEKGRRRPIDEVAIYVQTDDGDWELPPGGIARAGVPNDAFSLGAYPDNAPWKARVLPIVSP